MKINYLMLGLQLSMQILEVSMEESRKVLLREKPNQSSSR